MNNESEAKSNAFPSLVSDACDLAEVARFAIACADAVVRLADRVLCLEAQIAAIEGRLPS